MRTNKSSVSSAGNKSTLFVKIEISSNYTENKGQGAKQKTESHLLLYSLLCTVVWLSKIWIIRKEPGNIGFHRRDMFFMLWVIGCVVTEQAPAQFIHIWNPAERYEVWISSRSHLQSAMTVCFATPKTNKNSQLLLGLPLCQGMKERIQSHSTTPHCTFP